MARPSLLLALRLVPSCVAVVLCVGAAGCRRQVAPPEPPAKVRLKQLLELYRVYSDKHKKGPPSEQALREFGQKLSAKERDEYLIGDDLDGIFTSPRDNQKYVVRYGIRVDPGQTRAIAWEATAHNGMRYVALSTGYVEEYDDDTLSGYKK